MIIYTGQTHDQGTFSDRSVTKVLPVILIQHLLKVIHFLCFLFLFFGITFYFLTLINLVPSTVSECCLHKNTASGVR